MTIAAICALIYIVFAIGLAVTVFDDDEISEGAYLFIVALWLPVVLVALVLATVDVLAARFRR